MDGLRLERAAAEAGPAGWAVALRPLPGETDCGDSWMVKGVPGGVLVAAVDGIGHGPEAARAGSRAVAALKRSRDLASVDSVLRDCHRALLGTRGAAMSVARIDLDRGRLAWDGVGNVEGVIVRDGGARVTLVNRPGVVGYELPPLRSSETEFGPGSWLVLATDGIKHGFLDEVRPARAPQEVADAIVARHARAQDDALALVVRVRD